MRTAVTPISAEILREALQFPDDVKVIGEQDGNVHVLVESDRIPEGAKAVLAVWIKKGDEVEFKSFDPINVPAFVQEAVDRMGLMTPDNASPEGPDVLRDFATRMWRDRHTMTEAEWLQCGPILLGYVVAHLSAS